MNWLKKPNERKRAAACGFNLCWDREQSNACFVQIDLSKPCLMQV